MVKIKPLEAIVRKWVDVTPGRAPYYEAGIRAPREDWATQTIKAKDAWAAGVNAAIRDGRFEGGVKRAGTAKWQSKALTYVGRYSEGVSKAGPDYSAGFAPFHKVIAEITLPDRKARGDPANLDRVRVMATALHNKKVELVKTTSAGVAPS